MEEEYIDVHEGGESSWLQKIADHIKLREFRYEAHGDNMRIILERGVTIDLESGGEGICFSTRTVLPRGDDFSEAEEYIKDASVFLRVVSLLPAVVEYIVDTSLESYIILNARRCVKEPEKAIELIDRFANHLLKQS
ncbi:MAG: hypothetical protein ABWJ42_07275 [Sulfolobales archaeon]